MNKNKKLQALSLGMLSALLVGSIYAYHALAPGKYHRTGAYGVEVDYPAAWKGSPYQFYTNLTTTKPGVIVSSPDGQIKVAISPKYVGDTSAEHPESSNVKAEAMLVGSTQLKNASGVSAIQMVTHYYGKAVTSHYVANDMLITDKQLQALGLQFNKMTKINANENLAVPLNSTQPEAAVGFNSQEPLTLEQAVDWFKAPDVRTAHAILLSARVRS